MSCKTMRKARNIALAAGIAVSLLFACKKPEPERNCTRNGTSVVCPEKIRRLQREVKCVVSKHGVTVFSTEKKIPKGKHAFDLKKKEEVQTMQGKRTQSLYSVSYGQKADGVTVTPRPIPEIPDMFEVHLQDGNTKGVVKADICRQL